jgi:hypothetical protein
VFPLHSFCFTAVFPHIFFLKNYLYRIYFFNIELADNLALAFLICFFFFLFFQNCHFLHIFFFFVLFFSELFLLILFF